MCVFRDYDEPSGYMAGYYDEPPATDRPPLGCMLAILPVLAVASFCLALGAVVSTITSTIKRGKHG